MLSSTLIEKEIKDSFSIHFFADRQYESPSDRLTYNRIILISTGVGELKVDEHTFRISASELFLISKGQVVSFKKGVKFTGYELSFGDCFWEKAPSSANNCKAVLFNNAAANQRLPLIKEDHEELGSLFKSLLNEFEREEYINKLDAMAAYLKIIMIKIANVNTSLASGFDNYENKLYRQFTELISEHYQSSHEVAEYSKLLGISARKLADLSKRCSGKGAKELINGQLIAEAKRSLQFSSMPIKEIALQLNFATPDQFSHFFKKNVQVSPKDYRTLFTNLGV
ncbi:AraC family transcriptional regulator [Pedobacter sp. V48]|uniref:helix-turn-helix domain-containing protein n=1 Tax=Pedobacter sp. V48 TaxID=509635 RepID=UPI0003E4CBF2|nr:AraC family transcriptional regulator [Pedobacter sp. V48]ETZ24137.1 hypothetical protein N824_16490 [Pedobacter sp. V48]